jgi:hypothetical protein
MSDSRRLEIDNNYDFFQRQLGKLLPRHRGEFALIRRCEIVEFFARPGDAYRDGLKRFPDHLFSIQEVRSEPIELGHMSL